MEMTDKVSWKENPDGSMTFTLNGNTHILPNDELLPIRLGLFQVQQYQKTRRGDPAEIAWDIRFYQWILNHPQSREKAKQYVAARKANGARPPNLTPKREIAKMFGWVIP